MTHGSLFDGAGGLRIGFEQAGIETAWTLDLLTGTNIATAEPAEYAAVDIISGGPPCQKGSTAAGLTCQRTYDTEWPAMLRFIRAKTPAWVVVENVTGFIRQMVEWSQELQQLGYGCAGQVVDSRHWVPQQRARGFIAARMGADGLDLWRRLYANGDGAEGGILRDRAEDRRGAFSGPCADCLRGGIFAGLSARIPAYVGGGNAVSVPVAAWIGAQIVRVEGELANA